jgi:hypothetical protein
MVMKGIIGKTFGGGVAKVESDRAVTCRIECGFTARGLGISFSFPFVINGRPFNYSLSFEADKNETDTIFNDPAKLQDALQRAEMCLMQNIPTAIREAMRALGEAALFTAGIPITDTKAKMVERLKRFHQREVVHQLNQKTGRAKIQESDYPALIERERELCDAYQALKRDHDSQYKNYRQENHRRTHYDSDWQRVWSKRARSEHGHLPLRFVKLLADRYTAKQIAHIHLATEYKVGVSTLDRFILPRARRAQQFEKHWFVERF